jgi:hypothetical protein
LQFSCVPPYICTTCFAQNTSDPLTLLFQHEFQQQPILFISQSFAVYIYNCTNTVDDDDDGAAEIETNFHFLIPTVFPQQNDAHQLCL